MYSRLARLHVLIPTAGNQLVKLEKSKLITHCWTSRREITNSLIQTRGSRDYLNNCNDASNGLNLSVMGSSRFLKKMEQFYPISNKEAWLMSRSSNTANATESSILETAQFLRINEIDKEQLLRIPWILSQDKDALEEKMSILLFGEHMFLKSSHALGMCRLSADQIRNVEKTFFFERSSLPSNYRNKIYLLSNQLMIPVEEVTESLSRVPLIFGQSTQKIQSIVKLLNNYNIPKESIISDPWLFLQNISNSSERLEAALLHQTKNTKPWIIRCTDTVFERYIMRQKKLRVDAELLEKYNGCIVNMVAFYVNMNKEIVLQFIYDNHPIYRTRPQKVKNFLELMTTEGFSHDLIVRNLWLVKSSLVTLQRRINILKENDFPLDSASVLGTTPALFNRFIDRYESKLRKKS